MRTFKMNRKITQEECPWLEETFEINTIVFEYLGITYGCISPDGIAVSFSPNETPFSEIPSDALTEIEKA